MRCFKLKTEYTIQQKHMCMRSIHYKRLNIHILGYHHNDSGCTSQLNLTNNQFACTKP